MGRGRCVEDISLPGTLHLAILRSPHAHIVITAIDLSAARAAPGVRLALAGTDIAGRTGVIRPNWDPDLRDVGALDAQLDEAKNAFGEVRPLKQLSEIDWPDFEARCSNGGTATVGSIGRRDGRGGPRAKRWRLSASLPSRAQPREVAERYPPSRIADAVVHISRPGRAGVVLLDLSKDWEAGS